MLSSECISIIHLGTYSLIISYGSEEFNTLFGAHTIERIP